MAAHLHHPLHLLSLLPRFWWWRHELSQLLEQLLRAVFQRLQSLAQLSPALELLDPVHRDKNRGTMTLNNLLSHNHPSLTQLSHARLVVWLIRVCCPHVHTSM